MPTIAFPDNNYVVRIIKKLVGVMRLQTCFTGDLGMNPHIRFDELGNCVRPKICDPRRHISWIHHPCWLTRRSTARC
jgi:hypothetical protein